MSGAVVFDDVSFAYPDVEIEALRNVTLAVPEGSFVLVTGATGAGKSTLLRAMNGLIPHFSGGRFRGSVEVEGRDTRENAPFMYMEIVDRDTTGAIPVTMDVGDLLVFDSHLMHCSTDNVSDGIRAAMVYHFSPAGTEDRTPADQSINDWVPVRRGGAQR